MFFNLEMTTTELAERLLIQRAQVSSHRARGGYLSENERSRLVATAGEISHAKIWLDDSPALTVAQIAARSRQQKRRHGLGLVVIDYLQLIDSPRDGGRKSREREVAEMSRGLKQLARSLQVPVVCCAQLNREVENTPDKRPRLSHLRESGSLEQDSDVVLFLHRPEMYLLGEAANAVAGEAEVIVAKQRNGPTGTVDLLWRKEYMQFVNKAAGSGRSRWPSRGGLVGAAPGRRPVLEKSESADGTIVC